MMSYEDMREKLDLEDGESYQDILSLFDAQHRYGISRTALRDAVLTGKVYGKMIGGITKKTMYVRRADVIAYIALTQSQSKSKKPIPWRKQDEKYLNAREKYRRKQ